MEHQQFLHFLQTRTTPWGNELLTTLAEQQGLSRQEVLRHLFIPADAADMQNCPAAKDGHSYASLRHELSTPLNGVIGLSELLLDEPLTGVQRDFVETILQSGHHMLALIHQLLSVTSESREPVAESFDLITELKKCCTVLLSAAQQRQITLEVATADALVLRQLRDNFNQVMLNLISNAIKYNRVGGRVMLRTRIRNDMAEIDIEDTGVGIAAVDIGRLFRPFSRLKTTEKMAAGSGLGLMICRDLVARMGGTTEVNSVPEQGSTFTVILPLNYSAAGTTAEYDH